MKSSLLKPVRYLDQFVRTQYTRIGQKIPENHLYKVTTGLHLLGHLGAGIIPQPAPYLYGLMVGGPDFLLNLEGLKGDPPTFISDGEQVINSRHEFKMNLTRAIRFPLFVAGLGLVGKVIYDTANFFTNGEPIESDLYIQGLAGIGFLSMASSMYLKDQDPKLLDKKPSKIKALLESIYEKVKIKHLVNPIPVPIPIRYSTLEDCL